MSNLFAGFGRWTVAFLLPLVALGSGAGAQPSQTAKTPRPLWAGTLFYGVYKSTDGADHWVPASNGLPPHSGEGASANVSALAVSQSAPRIAYVAIRVWSLKALSLKNYTGSNRILVYGTTDGGRSWTRKSRGLPTGRAASDRRSSSLIAIDPTNPRVVYAEVVLHSGRGGLFRSRDGGGHWQRLGVRCANSPPGGPRVCGPGGGGATGLVINPRAPREIYAASAGVAKSTDAGMSWKLWHPYEELRYGCCTALAIDPGNPSVLYAGAFGVVYKTTDAGRTWVRLSRGLPRRRLNEPTSNVEVGALAVDPRRPGVVYAGMPRGLYKSTTGGRSWARVSPAEVHDLVIDPESGVVYAATSGCLGLPPPPGLICQGQPLIKSSNGGGSWRLATNLPTNTAVSVLALG